MSTAHPERLGHYRLLRKLGEGGMGEVFLAEDERLGREVALKRIRSGGDDESRQRFWREARAAAAVNHPHVCQIYEVAEDGGEIFLTMELLEGEPLEERLRKGALELHDAVDLALQVLDALAAVHRRGLVHRDLKPSNVFVTPRGVKLLDFGLARELPGLGAATAVTKTGQIVGTPLYMSPEQLRGEPVDARTDLFSFAAILFEMLAGRRAFEAPTGADIFHAILYEQPPALAGSPAIVAVDRLLRRALAKKREDRPPSAEIVARDLRVAATGASSAVRVTAHAMTRLVVLPFRSLRPDPEFDFLAVSLPDALASSLTGLGSLLVRSPMTAARFASETPDLKKIAQEAEVDLVVAGTLLRAGDKLRVSTQLLEAPSGTVVWSHGAVVSLGDIFALEEELVSRIVGSLKVPLTAREAKSVGRDVPASPRAYELYLRANEQAMRADGWDAARDLYLECLREGERFAPAWARLGRIHRLIAKFRPQAPDAAEERARAEAALARALELNPDLSVAHKHIAALEVEAGRADDALRRLLVRARSSPNDPELFAGLVTVTRYVGLLAPSLVAHEHARRLDPSLTTSVAYTHLMRGETRKAVETDVDVFPFMPVYALLFEGKEEEARALYAGLESRVDAPITQMAVGWGGALAREEGESLDATRRLIAAFPDPEGVFLAARLFLAGGHFEDAVKLVARAVSEGYHCAPTLDLPWLAPMRGDARFEAARLEAAAGAARALETYLACGGPQVLGAASPPSDASLPTIRSPRP